MIKFPIFTHEIHLFTADKRIYVADLDTGHVIEIDEIDSQILEVCSFLDNDQIKEKLSVKYEEEEIIKSFQKLEKFKWMGFLFSSKPQQDKLFDLNKRLKIFVTSGFLYQRSMTSFLTNFNNYYLLTSLSKHADVYLAFPEENDEEEKIDLDVEGIHKVPFKLGRTYSPAKFIPNDCDGILMLSPFSFSDLPFFRYNSIPVISRIYSDMKLKDMIINSTLDKYAALKDYDVLSPDASWVKDSFSFLFSLFPDIVKRFHTIPNGVDLSVFQPLDKKYAKTTIAESLGNNEILEKPVIGFFSPYQPHKGEKIVSRLSALNPHIIFFVFDPILEHYHSDNPRNVVFFNIWDARDKEATPVIFNAFDALFFPAITGIPGSLVLEAMACGMPPIVACHDALPEEVGNAGVLVPLEEDNTFSIDLVSEKINFLLEDEVERSRLSIEAKKQASTFTWDKTAEEIISLFKKLYHKKALHQGNIKYNFPIIFSRSYNKAQEKVESKAVMMPNLHSQSVEEGLAITLLEEHTIAEVETVLMHILKDPEKVKRIIKKLV